MQIVGEQDGKVGIVLTREELVWVAIMIGTTNLTERKQKVLAVLGEREDEHYRHTWRVTNIEPITALNESIMWTQLNDYLKKDVPKS